MAIRINLHDVGFPGSSVGKESTCNMGDLGLIPGLGQSPGEGNSYPLQFSGLENSMDKGAWWATSLWGCKELDTIEQGTYIHMLRECCQGHSYKKNDE